MNCLKWWNGGETPLAIDYTLEWKWLQNTRSTWSMRNTTPDRQRMALQGVPQSRSSWLQDLWTYLLQGHCQDWGCDARPFHCRGTIFILKDAFSCIWWDNSLGLVQAVGRLRTLKAMLPSKQGYKLLKGKKNTCSSSKSCSGLPKTKGLCVTYRFHDGYSNLAWWLALLPTVVHEFSSAHHLTSHIIMLRWTRQAAELLGT